jgi:putative addiction module component (TIGR02574 family)
MKFLGVPIYYSRETNNMSIFIEQLAQDLMILGQAERAFLAHRLLDSLEDDADETVKLAWQQEISQRRQDLQSGLVNCTPVDEVITQLRGILRHARSHSPQG